MELSAEQVSWAWGQWAGSAMQRILHMMLVARIDAARTALETAPPEQLVRLQAEIHTVRWLLSEIHRADPPGLAKTFK